MKLLTVVGARPQFIKLAPLSRHLATHHSSIEHTIVHTGQHYDANMSEVFFDELEIPHPNFNLNVGSGSHGKQTGEMLIQIEEVLLQKKPDVLIVYGDTNSTAAGALAASKLHIPVAHIEAGLRSYNMFMPEEQNRVITDHLSHYLFCPTETAVVNLRNEGLYDEKPTKGSRDVLHVANVGDVMYDAVLYNSEIAEKKSRILPQLRCTPKEYILATIHRAENTDHQNRLKIIFDAFGKLSTEVILPLHPRTKRFIAQYGIKVSDNVQIIDPVGYLDMILLEKNASLIMTDSGGVQKEAYFMRTPCITLRDETEWVETVDTGWNMLVSDLHLIPAAVDALSLVDFSTKELKKVFGDGNSAEKILNTILG